MASQPGSHQLRSLDVQGRFTYVTSTPDDRPADATAADACFAPGK